MMFKRLSIILLVHFFLQGSQVAAYTGAKPEVVIETSKGTFTIELYPDKAPKTAANFLAYVDDGFYDGTIFHRVIQDFVIQGGGFESGMKTRPTNMPIKSESDNRLKNLRGTVAMARKSHPDTATSQFFVNLEYNASLDYKTEHQPGYTVFGRVSQGMDVIDKIAAVKTTTRGRTQNTPEEDVVLLSARRKVPVEPIKADKKAEVPEQEAGTAEQKADAPEQGQEPYTAGVHYVVLDRPVPTRDNSKIEVVEMFSYGCPHCYEFESLVKDWSKRQANDVDFWFFPAVWNEPMKLYARAYYTAEKLGVTQKIHYPLFTAIVIEQKSIRNENDLTDFFANHGVAKTAFTEAFNSTDVKTNVEYAEERVRLYRPAGTPEIVVNGKYRVDRMRAGGPLKLLAVTEFLINKERAALKE